MAFAKMSAILFLVPGRGRFVRVAANGGRLAIKVRVVLFALNTRLVGDLCGLVGPFGVFPQRHLAGDSWQLIRDKTTWQPPRT